jgi:hypothetical protein
VVLIASDPIACWLRRRAGEGVKQRRIGRAVLAYVKGCVYPVFEARWYETTRKLFFTRETDKTTDD